MGELKRKTADRGAHAGCINVEAPCGAVPIYAAEDRAGHDPGVCHQCLSSLCAGRSISVALLPDLDRPSEVILLQCHKVYMPESIIVHSVLRK